MKLLIILWVENRRRFGKLKVLVEVQLEGYRISQTHIQKKEANSNKNGGQ